MFYALTIAREIYKCFPSATLFGKRNSTYFFAKTNSRVANLRFFFPANGSVSQKKSPTSNRSLRNEYTDRIWIASVGVISVKNNICILLSHIRLDIVLKTSGIDFPIYHFFLDRILHSFVHCIRERRRTYERMKKMRIGMNMRKIECKISSKIKEWERFEFKFYKLHMKSLIFYLSFLPTYLFI